MCFLCAKLGLLIQKKKVHVYLENADLEGFPVSDIGPVIEVYAMPINCSVENMVEVYSEWY